MADLITLNDWQTQRGLANVANAQESLIITQCSARIQEFIGRTLGQNSFTEYLSGNGTQFVWLRNRPLTTTGLTVWEDDAGGQYQGGTYDNTTLLTLGTDYALPPDQPDGVTSRSGLLLRMGANWFAPPTYNGLVISPVQNLGLGGNIKVTYTAGYATIPTDVQQACMFLCAVVKQMALLGQQLQQESDESYSYVLRPLVNKAFGGLPAEVLGMIARYRNQPIA